ncbi:uncharacterized protein LOC109613601 [Musca domestica]|uniref:Uncharacterized protein LOC109613601 n=1 Tax=Musca domestica TaxID=7370 RepID=A0A9J7DKP5_MUSDO|nr:uncharacterized protein LOC109613601 [Musca domestica]
MATTQYKSSRFIILALKEQDMATASLQPQGYKSKSQVFETDDDERHLNCQLQMAETFNTASSYVNAGDDDKRNVLKDRKDVLWQQHSGDVQLTRINQVNRHQIAMPQCCPNNIDNYQRLSLSQHHCQESGYVLYLFEVLPTCHAKSPKDNRLQRHASTNYPGHGKSATNVSSHPSMQANDIDNHAQRGNYADYGQVKYQSNLSDDHDVIFGTADKVFGQQCIWMESRIEWLSKLEARSEEVAPKKGSQLINELQIRRPSEGQLPK